MPFEPDSGPAAGRFVPDEAPDAPSASRSVLDWASDTGSALLKGAVALPQAVVGLADIPTGGRVGKALEGVGYRPGAAKEMIDAWYSPQQKAANAAVQQADGFVDTTVAALKNPSSIVGAAVESLPQMLGGAGVARGAMKLAPKLAPWLAGAAGEGALAAGSAASEAREKSADGLLSGRQALAAVGSGVGTAAFGAAGGKLAQRFGLGDVDTMLAAGTSKLSKAPPGFIKQVIGSGISEGAFEELPQSIQEKMWENWGAGKPLGEGVGNAAAMGLLTGAAMGVAGGGYTAARGGRGEAAPPVPRGADAGAINADEVLGAPADPAPTAAATGATSGQEDQTQEVLTGTGAATAAPTDAEKALANVRQLTSLDRVQKIDGDLAKLDDLMRNFPDQVTDDAVRLTMQLRVERAQLSKDWPAIQPGAETTFTTEAGARLAARYALVEADDLQSSHDEHLRVNPAFPPELQPRQRERAASQQQIAGIVGKLDPARLGASPDAANGAPIIGADGLVESGNARSIALKRVYQANGQKAIDYKAFIQTNAAQFGVDPAAVDSMRKPVLVRVRTTPVDRAEFARQANADTVARMSPSEQARSDAARVDSMEDLNPDEQGDFATSRDFIRRFMARLPATEQSGMIDAEGRLSSQGYSRVRNAVLAKAYGDSPVLTRMVESMDDNLRNISKALMIAAPRVAKARGAIAAGRLHDADMTPHLVGAAEWLSRIKDSGNSVDDTLAQAGLLGDDATPEARDMLRFLADNVRRPRKIADFIGAYFDALEAAGDPAQGDLLGETKPPTTTDLMGAARRTQEPTNAASTAADAKRGNTGEAAPAESGAAGQPTDAPGGGRGDQGDGAAGAAAANEGRGPGWERFAPETGTLGIPRADMPQVKVKLRPQLYAFLETMGISNTDEEVAAADLKPTQAEYSPDKADRARELEGDAAGVLSRAPATKTPAFKAWFGDSKIVDAEGKPKLMFHGTGANITAFRPKQAGAIFVTEEPLFAESYSNASTQWLQGRGEDGAANIMPVYARAERPFDYDKPAHVDALVAKVFSTAPTYTMGDGEQALVMGGRQTLYSREVLQYALTTGQWALIEAAEVQSAIKALGHDAFFVDEDGFKNLGLYDSKQIKSATGNRGSFDANEADIRLSDTRGAGAATGTSAGITQAALLRVSSRIADALPGLPKVHVFSSPQALPKSGATGALRTLIEERGALNDAEGALHEGEIYLFASNIADELRAEHVLAEHEAAHAGLRGVLGPRLPQTLQAIANNNTRVRRAAAALVKDDPTLSLIEAIEEVIVDMPSAELVKLQGWRRVVERARDWLEAHGFERLAAQLDRWLAGHLSDQQQADLFVADLVREARAFVARKSGAGRPDGTALSAPRDVTQTEAFKRWFGGSKVVDADGKPLVVYHGTDRQFDQFRGNSYFTPDPSDASKYSNILTPGKDADHAPTVLPVYLSMKRPKVIGVYATRADIDDARESGKYDGVIVRGVGGSKVNHYITFAPEQVKSAISNSTFDPTNPDIRLSTAPATPATTPAAPTAADRANTIIQTAASTPAPIDALVSGLTNGLRINRATTMLYGLGARLIDRVTPETVKAGVISDYGVPEAVIDRRALMVGGQRMRLASAGKLLEKLATLTRAESRVAYEWMNMGEDTDPHAFMSAMRGLPEESVEVLQEVQKMIDDLSKEAVRLGQLDPEAFKRHRMAYLRRSYVKHTQELSPQETAARAGAIRILGDQYKGRGMVKGVPMKQVQNVAPDWWKRKMVPGKADTSLKGEKFERLERREVLQNNRRIVGASPSPTRQMPIGLGGGSGGKTPPYTGTTKRVMVDTATQQIPGLAAAEQKSRLAEVVYWPVGVPKPAKYRDWDSAGTWEVRDTKAGDLVMWRDFTKDEREKMGEIDEARFAIAKTLHGMIHDIEVGSYLEWLAQSQSKADGDTLDGPVVEAGDRALDTFKIGTWVQVPDAKIPGTSVARYGKLAGRYIPGPVWSDLRQIMGGGRIGPEWYRDLLRAWKTSKTALSPGVHTNNVMSNLVMADWHDVTAGHVAKSLRIILAANEGKAGGALGAVGRAAKAAGIVDAEAAREIMARYEASGGAIGSWVTSEIAKDQLAPIVELLQAEVGAAAQAAGAGDIGVYSALQHLMHARFPAAWEAFKGSRPAKAVATDAGNLIDLYQAEDDVFRLAAWLKAKEGGASDAEAGKRARKSFLDYSINAPWISALRQTALPFVAFTYRAFPMLLETAAKRPHKLIKLMALAGMLNYLGVLIGGGGDDEERKLLPEEKAGRIWGMVPKLIRMPWNDSNNSPVYLDIRRWIPVGDVIDIGQGHAALGLPPVLVPGGPLALLMEFAANKSQFTGKPITLETDTAIEKTTKVLDWLYKAFAPNILGLPGTYATQGVIDAAKGKTDAFGRELSVPTAATSAFGVKLGAYPADVLRRQVIAKRDAEISEIDRDTAAAKRQLKVKGITEDEFGERLARQNAKKLEIMLKAAAQME